jgi:hypothetical protein
VWQPDGLSTTGVIMFNPRLWLTISEFFNASIFGLKRKVSSILMIFLPPASGSTLDKSNH